MIGYKSNICSSGQTLSQKQSTSEARAAQRKINKRKKGFGAVRSKVKLTKKNAAFLKALGLKPKKNGKT